MLVHRVGGNSYSWSGSNICRGSSICHQQEDREEVTEKGTNS